MSSLAFNLINELCFCYEYDNRNRMFIKKVPDAGEVQMVYDVRDRLTMTGDFRVTSSMEISEELNGAAAVMVTGGPMDLGTIR